MPHSRAPSGLPDKNYLFGRYQKHEDRRNRLGMKAAHKALDIPEDDMHIETRQGMTWKELAVIGALLAALAGGVRYFATQPAESAPAAPAAVQDTDTVRTLEVRPWGSTPGADD